MPSPTLTEVHIPHSQILFQKYSALDSHSVKCMRHAARAVRGHTVIHINATPHGGGVAELLERQVIFERSLGIQSRWFAMRARPSFFKTTKKIHNYLQGTRGDLTKREWNAYAQSGISLASSLLRALPKRTPVLVLLHDPQPLPLISHLPKHHIPIVRFHMDLSSPNMKVLQRLNLFIKSADKIIVSNKLYASHFLKSIKKRIFVIPPAIDPLTQKNRSLSHRTTRRILKTLHIDSNHPLVAQISRFDRWKNPLGVIRAYKIAKKKIPKLSLVLAGIRIAHDDPEADMVVTAANHLAKNEKQIHIFSKSSELGKIPVNLFINALLTTSTAVIQNSTREGFGLTITEAMWKKKVVIANNATGTRMQIKNEWNGLFASSDTAIAKAIVRLAHNKKLRTSLGSKARTSVKKYFLFPRFIVDHVKLYATLLEKIKPPL